MDEELWNLIDQTDWRRVSQELEEYAFYKAMRYQWRYGDDVSLIAKGKSPDDVAYEAIKKTLTGERHWNIQKHPNILDHLKSVVDSLIYHLVHSWNHDRMQPLPENENGTIREDILSKHASISSPDPEAEVLAKERDETFFNMLFEAAAGDAELEVIVEAMMDGYFSASEISEERKLDIRHVYNLIRKLRRRVPKMNVDKE